MKLFIKTKANNDPSSGRYGKILVVHFGQELWGQVSHDILIDGKSHILLLAQKIKFSRKQELRTPSLNYEMLYHILNMLTTFTRNGRRSGMKHSCYSELLETGPRSLQLLALNTNLALLNAGIRSTTRAQF